MLEILKKKKKKKERKGIELITNVTNNHQRTFYKWTSQSRSETRGNHYPTSFPRSYIKGDKQRNFTPKRMSFFHLITPIPR